MVLGNGTPTVRHFTKESAQREAERLARENAGGRFVVLESIATVTRCDLLWTRHDDGDACDDSDGVPF